MAKQTAEHHFPLIIMTWKVTQLKKATIHQLTTMLSTPKMSNFQVITIMLTTGAVDLTL